ncbi:MAG: hypothetical protein AAGA48_09280 [Myxococcota bacterium]
MVVDPGNLAVAATPVSVAAWGRPFPPRLRPPKMSFGLTEGLVEGARQVVAALLMVKRAMSSHLRFGLLLLFVLFGACAKGEDPDAVDVIIPDTTKIVEPATLDALVSATPDLSELVLPAGNVTWEPDDVIVSTVHPNFPYGMLRRVTALEDTVDGNVRVVTEFASLSEAVERGSLNETIELDPSTIVDRRRKVPVIAPPAGGFFFGFDDLELSDDDGDPTTRDDRVWLDGSFSFRPSVDLIIDFDGFELQQLTFELRADQDASVRIQAGRETTIDERFLVEEIELSPIVFSIGPLPVVLVPRLQLFVGIDGRVTAELSAGVAASSSPRVGFGYQDGGWGEVVKLKPMAQFDVPSFRDGAAGEVRAWAGPRAELAAYGIAGAYGELRGFVKADLDSQRDPWWILSAGLEAHAGLFVRIFSISLAEYEFPPATFEQPLADAGEPAPLAGAQVAPWSRTFAGDRTDSPNQVLETSEGGLLVLARTNSFEGGADDAWLLKLDRLGQVSWQVAFDGLQGALNGYERPDGDYVIAAGATSGGTDTAYLLRLDPNGTARWAQQLVHADDAVAIKAVAPMGDDIFAVGAIGSGTTQDFWGARIDPSGQVLWARRIGGAEGDVPTSLLHDGNVWVVVGETRSFDVNNIGGWAVGFDASGNVPWQRVYDQPGAGNEVLTGVIPSPDGYRITGHIFGDALLLEVDDSGALERASTFESGSNFHQIYASAGTADGGAVLAGVTNIGDASDTWLLRLTPQGTVLWSTGYGGPFGEAPGGITSASDLAQAVVVTDDDGLVVVSNVQRDETSWDLWLMKVSGTGVISFDDPDYNADALSGSFVEIPVEDAATSASAEALVLTPEALELDSFVPDPVQSVQALP